MRFKIYFAIQVLTVATLVLAAVIGSPGWVVGGLSVVALVLFVLIYRAVSKPLSAVSNGLYLLRSQDYASRLARTGQVDADEVVKLFNGLMDRLKSERLKLQEQNNFLSRLLEVSPMGVAVCNLDGDIIETNRAWNAIVDTEIEAELENVAEGSNEVLRLGQSHIVRVWSLWFMDGGFRRRFYLVERLTDEIVSAEKAVYNRIIRTMGHEINNTLGSVLSVLETVGDASRDDQLLCDTVSACSSSCSNLINFVRQYSLLVKLPEPVLEPTDLAQWVRSEIPSLAPIVTPGVQLVVETEKAGSHTVNIDRGLMERVLVNIVKNAVESIGARDGGFIRISVSKNELRVADNGGGISDEVSQRLFTPFFSTKRPDRGLGLMLVADILRGHGARFSLTTSRESNETEFRMIF